MDFGVLSRRLADVALGALLLAALGCGDGSTISGGAGGAGASSSGSGPEPTMICNDALSCDMRDCAADCVFSCEPSTPLCDMPTFAGYGNNAESVDDMAAVTCMLEALRDLQMADEAPGTVSWTLDELGADPHPGITVKRIYTVHLRTSRQEFVQLQNFNFDQEQIAGLVTGPRYMADPSAFDACLALTEPQPLYDCLFNAIGTGCTGFP